MTKRVRRILLTGLIVGLAVAPGGAAAQDTQPSAESPTPSAPSTSVPAAAGSEQDAAESAGSAALGAPESSRETPRGAVLSPERFQDLQETLAEMQSRLQGAMDVTSAAIADGQVRVEVPPMLTQDQVQDLLDTVSRLRWTLNDAMDVAGDLAVRAGEPQGTLVISTSQLIGMALGATGAAVVVDLLGGGGIATTTAAVAGAAGGYWVASQETWTWAGARDAPPIDLGGRTPEATPN